MPSHADVTFGRIALKNRLVTCEALWQALVDVAAAYRQGREMGVADALCRRGALEQKTVARIRRAEALTMLIRAEKLLGRLVVERNLAPYEVVHQEHETLKAEGFRNGGLGQKLVERGVLTDAQVDELFDEQMMSLVERRERMEVELKTLLLGLGPAFGPEQEVRIRETFGLGSGTDASASFPNVTPPSDQVPVQGRVPGVAGASPSPSTILPPPSPTPGGSGTTADPDRWANVTSEDVATVDADSATASSEDASPIYGYTLLEELGKGSMGVVYKARHLSSGRTVALKILPLALAKDVAYIERFKREAIAAMRLHHPNIVRAYDFGGSEDYYYLALELIEGEPLDIRLNREGRIAERDALRFILQVARALDHAHATGIIHRDIKPENVIITQDGIAKLSDFGIVKLLDMEEDSSLTMPGTTVGTPYYISPEQARGDDLDIRSDIYSLGITLFHVVTGQLPFTGKSQGAVLLKHITEPLPDPRTLCPNLSVATVQIIQRMAKKLPDERYQSPKEIVGALETVLR